MSAFNTYTTDVVALDYGLDLTTPKPVAQSGTLAACLNYEITDRVGLRRIDGFERFDGRLGGWCSTFWEVGHTGGPYVVGDIVVVNPVSSIATERVVVGTVVQVISAGLFRIAVLNDDSLPVLRDQDGLVTALVGTSRPLGIVNKATKQVTEHGAPTFVRDIKFAVTSPSLHRELINSYQTMLRTSVTPLPSTPVMSYTFQGIHYAASGAKRLELTATLSTAVVVVTTPTMSVLGNSLNSATIRVLRVDTAPGRAVIHYVNEVGDFEAAATSGAFITGLSGTVNGVAITGTTFAMSAGSVSISGTMATVYLCADEQVEFDRLPGMHRGWRPLDMGWELSFSNGNSPTALAKFDRGLGVPTTSITYWLSDGTTTYQLELNAISVVSGTFPLGTATGVMAVSNLVRTAGADVPPTATGWALYRSSTIEAGNIVANVTSALRYNYLPGLETLVASKSRYQLRDRNFYATDGLGLVFGVTGASRPFYMNASRFSWIYVSSTETTFARHIGFISSSLALGYADGRVPVSVPGEPWNYSGVDGAFEYGAGYPVRGLLQMQGDTIGVFTSGGVFAIQGTTQDNYVGRVLVPDIGAVEYTVVSIGDAVFVSPAGVVSLSQSEKYGDFVGTPISFKVNPILRPKASKYASIVSALPVRNKNQYRLYCSDGTVFTMTFRDGKGVETTTQTYLVGRSSAADNLGRHLVPLALSSVLDEDGQETVLFSHFSPSSRTTSAFMYKLDSGWGFDGTSIPSSFDLNWYFAQQPFLNKVLRKVRIDGEGRGLASIRVRTAADYLPSYSRDVEGNMPRLADFISAVDRPYSRMVNVEERGLNIAVKVEHSSEFTAPEPPHTLQTLFIQFTGAKSDA